MSDTADTTPELPDDVAVLKGLIGVQSPEIERLKEQLRLAAHKRFGASSEKADPDQLGLFNEAEKLCPCGSGHARPRIGEMVAEQADIVPAKVQVLQHVRFKYGPCRACDGVFPADPEEHRLAQYVRLRRHREIRRRAAALSPGKDPRPLRPRRLAGNACRLDDPARRADRAANEPDGGDASRLRRAADGRYDGFRF